MRPLDLTGEVFDKLTAVRPVQDGAKRKWLVRCACGRERRVLTSSLTSGNTTSCGKRPCCHHVTTHGASGTPEYRAFHSAKRRCTKPTDTAWAYYGGRGIKFLFKNFEQFLAEVKYKPSKEHTLDRKDSNGNYEPGNVRWATKAEQTANRKFQRCFQCQTVLICPCCTKQS
jgi:hypothetical protein